MKNDFEKQSLEESNQKSIFTLRNVVLVTGGLLVLLMAVLVIYKESIFGAGEKKLKTLKPEAEKNTKPTASTQNVPEPPVNLNISGGNGSQTIQQKPNGILQQNTPSVPQTNGQQQVESTESQVEPDFLKDSKVFENKYFKAYWISSNDEARMTELLQKPNFIEKDDKNSVRYRIYFGETTLEQARLNDLVLNLPILLTNNLDSNDFNDEFKTFSDVSEDFLRTLPDCQILIIDPKKHLKVPTKPVELENDFYTSTPLEELYSGTYKNFTFKMFNVPVTGDSKTKVRFFEFGSNLTESKVPKVYDFKISSSSYPTNEILHEYNIYYLNQLNSKGVKRFDIEKFEAISMQFYNLATYDEGFENSEKIAYFQELFENNKKLFNRHIQILVIDTEKLYE